MIQHHTFPDGGYVLHRVTIPNHDEGHYSAWFNHKGILLDAERIVYGMGSTRNVRPSSPLWRLLESIGRSYRPKQL